MRNRRLLTLAVLAVALGFATFAQAETAVVTVVESGASFDIRYSISGGVSIGSTASTPGALDVVIKAIQGLDGATVDSVAVEAPEGSVTDGVTTVAAGFNATTGIRNVTYDSGTGVYNAVLLQPAAYDDPCTAPNGAEAWTAVQDAAVLIGVGTGGSTAANATLPFNGVDWEGGTGPAWDGDTLVFSGTFTAGVGSQNVGVSTYGPDSFSVLPADANDRYTGPLYDDLYDVCEPVDAVVIQYTSAANGGGTVAPTVPTTLKVEYGNVVLGASYASSDQVTLLLSDANTSITLAADKTVGGLDIQTANPGTQVLDVNASRLDVVGGDRATIQGIADAGGIISSQIDLVNELLVITDVGGQVAIKATIKGDVNLDGAVDGFDYTVISTNWLTAFGEWSEGDLADDGFIDGFDYTELSTNWLTNFVPTGGAAVPEPATMALLAFGGLAVLRRRRKS